MAVRTLPFRSPERHRSAIVRLLAWLAPYREIYPFGTSWMIDANVANIEGHRVYPAASTSCPGDYGYSLIPYFRQATWDRIPDRDYGWLGHNTPATLKFGETAATALAIANHGRLTWAAGGANPVRVGYHWYRANGTLYTQPPGADLRTPLPGDVSFGRRVDVTAGVTAPREAGNFTLKWDLVHEGIAWFHDQGAIELAVPVTVLEAPFAPTGV